VTGDEKLKGEGTPPLDKRSMVSEADLINRIKKVNKGEEEVPEIPSKEVLLLFACEKLYDIHEVLKELLDFFKGIKPEEKDKPVAPPAPSVRSRTPPASSRVNEIVDAFKEYTADVTVDIEESTQFVIVKPKGFLGSDTFSKVAGIVRGLGGEYVSAGKASKFKIPKMGVKKETAIPPNESDRYSKASEDMDDVTKVKVNFSEDLANMLTFTDDGSYVKVAGKSFLGSENFAKIAAVVRALSGEYISAGKDSHFKVPKPK